DGARLVSSITATLFRNDEFILREFSPETLLAGPAARRWVPNRQTGNAGPRPAPPGIRRRTRSRRRPADHEARRSTANEPGALGQRMSLHMTTVRYLVLLAFLAALPLLVVACGKGGKY